MGDYLAFRRMITPAFIQVIFWVAVVGIVIGGLVTISHGRTGAGLALIVLGPLGVRIYAEILMVIFRIHDNVFAIRSAKVGDSAPPAPS
jgi:hypothetical protein